MITVEFYEKENGWCNHTIWEGHMSALPSVGQRLTGFFHKSGVWVVKEIHWYFGQDNEIKVLIRCRRPYFWEFVW